jgi:AraC-like DNA-binding protein
VRDQIASGNCAECSERLFAAELQSFLGKCQALVGAITFAGDSNAGDVLESTIQALPRPRTPGQYKLLRALITEFLEACARGAPEYDRLRVDDWEDRFALAETFRGACEAALLERVWSGRPLTPHVHRALAEVRRRGTEPSFNVESAARACGVSGPYLLRCIRAELGVSFADVLRRHRIGLARRRLAVSNESIKEVAGKVGYDSCSRFVKDFKRECGVTPSSFRVAVQARSPNSVRGLD